MAHFRIESVFDTASGCYFNELYYPDTSATPLAVTAAIYGSLQAAETGAVDMLKRAMPTQPVRVIP